MDYPALIVVIGSMLAAFGSWWFQAEKQKRKREMVAFMGAGIAIIGAFWSSSQQTAYEQKIGKLNETILENVTGGNSYCYVEAGPVDMDPNRYWALTLTQAGEQPCFDVTIQIKDVDAFRQTKDKRVKPIDLLSTMSSKVIGTVPPKSVAFVVKALDLNGLTRGILVFSLQLEMAM